MSAGSQAPAAGGAVLRRVPGSHTLLGPALPAAAQAAAAPHQKHPFPKYTVGTSAPLLLGAAASAKAGATPPVKAAKVTAAAANNCPSSCNGRVLCCSLLQTPVVMLLRIHRGSCGVHAVSGVACPEQHGACTLLGAALKLRRCAEQHDNFHAVVDSWCVSRTWRSNGRRSQENGIFRAMTSEHQYNGNDYVYSTSWECDMKAAAQIRSAIVAHS
jgi:hypothetical protein